MAKSHHHPVMYAQVYKKYSQAPACSTYSRLDVLDEKSTSSSVSPPSPPHRPIPPANYTPTNYEYKFFNFGLPHYEGNTQYYNLINGVTWLPNTPTTLILAMNNLHLLRVGLSPLEVKTINSIMFEIHRAMSSHLQSIEVEYLTHNSILFMKIDDQTSVQLLRDDYICMAPVSILTRWPTSSLNAVTLKVTIGGLRRCCGRLEPIFHVKSMMLEDESRDWGL